MPLSTLGRFPTLSMQFLQPQPQQGHAKFQAHSFESVRTTIIVSHPTSQGSLKPFLTSPADLPTIEPAAESFLKDNFRLNVLFLNPDATADSDNVDLAMRASCLVPFLLMRLLYPLMHRTATHFCHLNTSIRIVYVSSVCAGSAPRNSVQLVSTGGEGGWEPERLSGRNSRMQRKAGLYTLAHSEIKEYRGRIACLCGSWACSDAVDGVYPWHTVYMHGCAGTTAEEGEKDSVSARFYQWCERQIKPFHSAAR